MNRIERIIDYFKRERNGWCEHTRYYTCEMDTTDLACLVKQANELGMKGFSILRTERYEHTNELMLVIKPYSYWKRMTFILKNHLFPEY